MGKWPEWKPISEHDGKGRPVLLWAVSEDDWHDAEDDGERPVYSAMVGHHSIIQPGTWWLSGTLNRVYEPTHWLPLPPAPEGGE